MKVGLFINTQFPRALMSATACGDGRAGTRGARCRVRLAVVPAPLADHPMQMLQITPLMAYIAAHAEGMTIGPNILILPPLNLMHVSRGGRDLRLLRR